jgi:hypothetical protein
MKWVFVVVVDRKVNVKWGFHAIRQYSLEPFRVKF